MGRPLRPVRRAPPGAGPPGPPRPPPVADRVRHSGRPALIFVRYGPDKVRDYEWVYNAADIDAAPIVWAREISPEQDQRLMDYYPDRHVLRLDVYGRQSALSSIRAPTRD